MLSSAYAAPCSPARGHGAACSIGSRRLPFDFKLWRCVLLILPSLNVSQFLCWYQQRFSSIPEGIETPSKNINPMTSFNNCLAKERLLKVIKVPVTLPVATVVTLNPIVYYSFLRMRTWRCQCSAAFSLLFYSTQQNRFCELCKCFPGTSTMCSEVWCEGT